MKVKCTYAGQFSPYESSVYGELTVGKVYDVVRSYQDFYVVVNDVGDQSSYYTKRFEEVYDVDLKIPDVEMAQKNTLYYVSSNQQLEVEIGIKQAISKGKYSILLRDTKLLPEIREALNRKKYRVSEIGKDTMINWLPSKNE